MKLIIIFCCIFSFANAEFNRNDDIISVDSENNKMNKAIRNAQKTLPIFFKCI